MGFLSTPGGIILIVYGIILTCGLLSLVCSSKDDHPPLSSGGDGGGGGGDGGGCGDGMFPFLFLFSVVRVYLSLVVYWRIIMLTVNDVLLAGCSIAATPA